MSHGFVPIGAKHLVATTYCSRLPFIHLPTISSVRPAVVRSPPSGYASAVSRNVMPFSAAWSRMAKLEGSSTWRPNVMVPRQMRDTWSPVRPRRTCCTAWSFPSERKCSSGSSIDLERKRKLRHPGAGLEPREVRGDRGPRRVHVVRGHAHHVELGFVDE